MTASRREKNQTVSVDPKHPKHTHTCTPPPFLWGHSPPFISCLLSALRHTGADVTKYRASGGRKRPLSVYVSTTVVGMSSFWYTWPIYNTSFTPPPCSSESWQLYAQKCQRSQECMREWYGLYQRRKREDVCGSRVVSANVQYVNIQYSWSFLSL